MSKAEYVKEKNNKRSNVKPCKGIAVFHPSEQPWDGKWDHFLGKDRTERQYPKLQQFL